MAEATRLKLPMRIRLRYLTWPVPLLSVDRPYKRIALALDGFLEPPLRPDQVPAVHRQRQPMLEPRLLKDVH